MAGLSDLIRSAFPGGNIGKPLLLALGALLASGTLFKSEAPAGPPAGAPSPQPTTDTTDAGSLLGGLGGLLRHLEQGGLGNATNSWIGAGQNQPVSPGQVGPALGPNILNQLSQMTGLSTEELTKLLSQGLPAIVNALTPNGRLPTAAELSKMMQ